MKVNKGRSLVLKMIGAAISALMASVALAQPPNSPSGSRTMPAYSIQLRSGGTPPQRYTLPTKAVVPRPLSNDLKLALLKQAVQEIETKPELREKIFRSSTIDNFAPLNKLRKSLPATIGRVGDTTGPTLQPVTSWTPYHVELGFLNYLNFISGAASGATGYSWGRTHYEKTKDNIALFQGTIFMEFNSQANATYLLDLGVSFGEKPASNISVVMIGSPDLIYGLDIPIVSNHLLVPIICPSTTTYGIYVHTPTDKEMYIFSLTIQKLT